jgi:hypothetical protein
MKTAVESFKVTGEIVIGDPCYSVGMNPVVSAKKGNWVAHVETSNEGAWGDRISKILVHHEGFSMYGKNVRTETANIGVDSGQAGVFDLASYGEDGEDIYEDCCRKTLSKKCFGFISGGFVSSSGFGDGCYDVEIHKEKGVAVAVEITFIGDEQDEETPDMEPSDEEENE